MSAFQEYFLAKYFGYRRRYVAHIIERAPHRGSLAVLSEIARLAFMIAGNALCATVLWALTAGAAQAAHSSFWPALFAVCALVPTVFIVLSLGGLAEALRARVRVAKASGR